MRVGQWPGNQASVRASATRSTNARSRASCADRDSTAAHFVRLCGREIALLALDSRRCAQQRFDGVWRHRPAVAEALHLVAPVREQKGELVGRFDAFGNHVELH